jgi:hypothetical protein
LIARYHGRGPFYAARRSGRYGPSACLRSIRRSLS